MASLERTAYPQFSRSYSPKELQQTFSLSEDESSWLKSHGRSASTRLGLAVLLKSFQHLWYFPPVESIPLEVINHIRESLGIGERVLVEYPIKMTFYRHMVAIRSFLRVKSFSNNEAMALTEQLAFEAAELMDQRPDIINAMIDGLILHKYELPAFSTLDDMAEKAHVTVQRGIFDTVFRRLSPCHITTLTTLLQTDNLQRRQSEYNDLKKSARRSTRKHLEILVDHLDWLESLGNMDGIFTGVPDTKVRHFASQAQAYDVSELRECTEPKRYTLMLALIHRMQVRARDQLTEMFLRRVATIHKRAKEELEQIQTKQRSQIERLVGTLDNVLAILEQEPDDSKAGGQIREYLVSVGGINQIRLSCAQVQATSGSNYLPLVWKHFKSHRPILFRLVSLIEILPTSQDTALVDALDVIKTYHDKHRIEWIDENVDLSFASDRWRKLLLQSLGHGVGVNRRILEVCVFSYLADELRSGDLCVTGSEEFADYREQLLPWEECEALLPAYCEKIGLPANAESFVSGLREWLTETAQQLDDKFPTCRGDVALDANGEPVLRKVTAREIPPSAISLQNALTQRMPTRHILDVLANIEHWMSFTRHFGPLSGNEAKLKQPAERYLMTIFAMGCNLGPSQAARHLANSNVTAHMLSFVNRRHLSLENLEAAQRELNEVYLRLDLPKLWGDGKTVAADGTQYDFYDENLLAGYHFRYRKMGAVAYRHVANNYIAVFRHFIPPGVWEAIYVIEGLLKAGLSVEADTVHADTQGQSATVFAFTHLLGIKLMPRIRNWKNLILYRPDKATKYQHINRLFDETADWDLIEKHWLDLMQVALSIYAGKISSAILLRKLGSYSRKNRLYFAARQLGNVVRTSFLLEWIGSRELRQEVTANTNKIESYNGFAKWLSFGGDVIAVNEPDEQQKRLRYNDLIASALILQNTVDMMRTLNALEREGWKISEEDVSFLSPYQVSHVKRFGEYNLKLKRPHEAWIRDDTFQQAVAIARRQRHTSPTQGG
ncbi:Tn3 family transposase [Chromobacterium violaceum]|uniref:Transposase and inactivated derivatives, TnpA family n=1 Tax=Chromobacterium violaceum TaxID=536 RepID=A0AAX2M837_CHRVL|nr:Tn3 family transposase [Chromobacterium violaceum]OLZ73895.1 Tn3 family transposase [Chromobacterium violaceum]STB63595.1 Transposase and inactivated derivatives, TnpA family [Chromobacterium violaceum]STB63874.1 Transposase and inactivated derivatives, TnpA family [Chromobacterium violaceum]SUX32622.1 Transposase and inactivated derivatives, TnpA family [Chromobacterium violaceum]